MVESACGLGCLVLGWFFGVFVPFSTICLSSLPSTMTWAPCPHGVCTRGKGCQQLCTAAGTVSAHIFFFHEYGRRVGMVPRSSLKGGKNSLMVEKRTRKPNTTQNKQTPQPRAHRPCLHHHVVFPLCKVKLVRRKRASRGGPELTNEKHVGAGLCSSKVAPKYIGSRAFLDCTAFRRLAKMAERHKWRGVYAEENAFAICPDMRWPLWLHMIPDMGYTPGLG